jgi:hypothetical protein
MILQNGTMQLQTGGFAELDGDGNVFVAAPESWSAPLPCRVATGRRDDLAAQNGIAHVAASYEVLADSYHKELGGLPSRPANRRIRLTRMGEPLGEFSIASAELLEAVGAIKIVV